MTVLEGDGACTEPATEPGIHLYSVDGQSTWLYDTGNQGVMARVWQPLAQRACEPSDYMIEFDAEPATAQLATWVNVHPQGDTVCELDLSGTLSAVDMSGEAVLIEGTPAEVHLTGQTPYVSPTDEWLFSQVWIWQNWCGDDVQLQLDLDDGFSAQLPGSPRCSDAASPSNLVPVDRNVAG